MEDREQLDKIDILRARFHIGYAEARAALEATNWNIVDAAVKLEAEEAPKAHGVYEELKVTGKDLIETVKRLLHEGNINRIMVKDDKGTELLNLPVNGLLAVTVIIPILTAIGAVVVLAMDYTVMVEREA
ncbi:MAG TPA: DUF4342 domain-containing protein [Symbiobacteriaceae bacterium]